MGFRWRRSGGNPHAGSVQVVKQVSQYTKHDTLVGLLKERPCATTIVFVSDCVSVGKIGNLLRNNGFSTTSISDPKPSLRNESGLRRFRSSILNGFIALLDTVFTTDVKGRVVVVGRVLVQTGFHITRRHLERKL